ARQELPPGEVAARSEEHDHVILGGAHGGVGDVPDAGRGGGHRSAWPPNSPRSADSRRSANSPSPRDAKRSNSAAVITFAGAPTSTAASTVQRPSPESDTRPWKFSR